MSIDLSKNIFTFPSEYIPKHFRSAAVLVALYFSGKDVQIILTKRSKQLRDHPGEISFPGGKLEVGEMPQQAAIREAHEEIGMGIAVSDIVGGLDEAWSGGGFHMTSTVALLDKLPHFQLNEEVEKIIIFDSAVDYEVEHIERQYKSLTFPDPTITQGGETITGTTAGLILEVLEAIKGEYTQPGERRLSILKKAFS